MSIAFEPKLQDKLDQIAQQLGKSAEEIAADAIRTHLENLNSQLLEAEERAYQQLLPALRQQYPQQYVAILKGDLLDHDADFEALFLRVKARVGNRAVLIRQVNDGPEEYYFRGPRLEQSS
jgi:hypothetical protein